MKKNVFFPAVRYAGAFIAWVIGSGFATGQEILQFFSSYHDKSAGVLLVNLAGFLMIGVILLSEGYAHRDAPEFRHYDYFCGRFFGRIYTYIIPVTLVLIISVLISGAGATMETYFSVNRYLGSVLMASCLLGAYLAGFERLVKIVSCVSPLVILFTVFVGIYTVFAGAPPTDTVQTAAASGALSALQAAPNWFLSAVLYLSLNFLCGSTYFCALGRNAVSRKAAVLGAVLGSAVLLVTITCMNQAILLHANALAGSAVPMLYLAERISGFFGAVFSGILLFGMFSSCSTMIWSFCSGFFRTDKKKNRLFAASAVLICTLLGFFPFGSLVSVAYPMIGYAGLFFIAAVLFRGGDRALRAIRKRKKASPEKTDA